MDPFTKKRKADENGAATASPAGGAAALGLTRDDVLRLLDPLSRDQLADIAAAAALVSAHALDAVRAAADRDPALRKLFVRGLGWETTSDSLRAIFSAYGDLEEAVVITDKNTGRSKGYGFVTFRHADSAVLALKEPSKKIDGRMTVTQLAAAGAAGGPSGGAAGSGGAPVADVSLRKIFVGNVPADMSSERLLAHFASYGEIEEGPLGFDKQTGKFRGFALFVYKTPEGAQASLVDSVKVIDGNQLVCKLAIEGKKGKQGQSQQSGAANQQQQQMMQGGPQEMQGGLGLGPGPQMAAQYGGPGSGMSSFGAFGGVGGGFWGSKPLWKHAIFHGWRGCWWFRLNGRPGAYRFGWCWGWRIWAWWNGWWLVWWIISVWCWWDGGLWWPWNGWRFHVPHATGWRWAACRCL